MMKKYLRIFSVMLCLAMVLGALPLAAAAQDSDVDVEVTFSQQEQRGPGANRARTQQIGSSVYIPLTSEDGENTGTPASYFTSAVIRPGKTTIVTRDISITETVGDSKLTHVTSTVTPSADNDLFSVGSCKEAEADDGYRYVYVGMGNISHYFASFLYDEPENEGDEPVYTDENGKSYYYHKQMRSPYADKYYVEGLYLDGELVEGLNNKFITDRSGTLQFVMYDSVTGEFFTTYCADLETGAEDGLSYNIVNLEDSTYYSDDEAAMIRSVALNGYWGTANTSDEGEAPTPGSLDAVKAMMTSATDESGQRIFSDEDVAALTDGIALTATQYAIWTYANKESDITFVNTYWAESASNCWGDIPEGKESSVELLFKLYNYLISLEPTEVEGTTADTIINKDNFVTDLSVTVLSRAEGHENNQDDDDTNDAYVTNLSFALAVTPARDNGDDLVVTVYDGAGNPLAKGRIAGEAQDGETVLIPDWDGNYTFTGITLVEGDQTFNITLDGVQNLEQGVYLYTADVRSTSQTMVGIASDQHNVNVSLDIQFEFSVDEDIVVREYWSTSSVALDDWDNPTGDNGEAPEPPDSEVPDNPESGDVPGGGQKDALKDDISNKNNSSSDSEASSLTSKNNSHDHIDDIDGSDNGNSINNVPQTGDNVGHFAALTILCSLGLGALALTGKRKKEF